MDNNILNVIKNRRSIRHFTDDCVSQEQIKIILEAGFCAPSAHNSRPCHFIVIDDKDIPTKFGDRAACRIVICGDSRIQKNREYLYQDCAAATQNMLLCIHGLGLGAVWCGIVAKSAYYKRYIDLLGLPKEIIPVSQIALGYPNEEKKDYERYDEKRVHHNKWQYL